MPTEKRTSSLHTCDETQNLLSARRTAGKCRPGSHSLAQAQGVERGASAWQPAVSSSKGLGTETQGISGGEIKFFSVRDFLT